MVLSHDIGIVNKYTLRTASVDNSNFLKTHIAGVVHSHYCHTAEDIATRTCFFSLRKNPIDTIISGILANHYKLYHIRPRDRLPELEPFCYTDWNKIFQICNYYCSWHKYYAALLQPDHRIIYYEDYLPHLSDAVSFRRTFPEKNHLLINYQQVHDRISQFEKIMLKSQSRFSSN